MFKKILFMVAMSLQIVLAFAQNIFTPSTTTTRMTEKYNGCGGSELNPKGCTLPSATALLEQE